MNVPFTASNYGSKISKDIRDAKISLKERGYIPSETIEFVKKYTKKITLPLNSIIIVVPSTSKTNNIPFLYAKEIQSDNLSSVIVDDSSKLFKANHSIEAKNNLHNRFLDPVDYVVLEKDKLRALCKNKQVFICDDISSTGESCINLKKRLNDAGIDVKGFLNITCVDKAYASKRDIERLYGKLEPFIKDKELLKNSINENYQGYLRKKIYRVELNIKKGNEHEHINKIIKSADIQRKLNLVQQNNEPNENVKQNIRLKL